ncbi:nuclear transport factor 2 family protein [Nocardia sp. NPDC004278]
MTSDFIDSRRWRRETSGMTDQNKHDQNKKLVHEVVTQFVGRGNLDVVESLLREDFVDHAEDVPHTNRADWIAAFRNYPLHEMRIEISRLFAEGDYVMMLSRRWVPGGALIAVADVFRIQDDLIAEHWEVVQPLHESDHNPFALL